MIEKNDMGNWIVAVDQLRESIDPSDSEALQELATLEARLYDNLTSEKQLGASENLRHDRARILYSLNRLALKYTRQFLTDLLLPEAGHAPILVPLPPFMFTPVTHPTFQGRMGELEWLNEQFDSLTGGGSKPPASRTVFIQGEMGIGKSRLLNAFVQDLLDQEKAYTVVRTLGDELAPNQMLAQLAVDVLYQYPEPPVSTVLVEALTKLASAIVQGKDFYTDPLSQEVPTDIALWRLIGELAMHRPLVLVLENLHAANWRLATFFEMTARLLLSAPVLVIGTARPESTEQAAQLDSLVANARVSVLSLRGLGEPATRALVDELCYPPDLGGDFYNRLYQHTQGNPYFVIEIINYLKSQHPPVLYQNLSGQWVYRPDVQDWPRWTSDNLIAFAQEQLKMLAAENPRAANDLKTAAVIGPRFPLRLLQRICNYSDEEADIFAQSISVMKRRGLIQLEQSREWIGLSDIIYRFQSPIIQEALYDWNPELHLTVAQLLGELYPDQQDQERLRFFRVRHYQLGGDERAAIEFLQAAVHDIAAKQQPFESIWLHEHLLDYSTALGRREVLDLNRGLGTLYNEVGRLDDAFAAYKRALAVAEELRERAVTIEITAEMAWLRVKQERFEEAQDLFDRALSQLRHTSRLPGPLSAMISRFYRHLPEHLPAMVNRLYGGLFLERLATRVPGGRRQDAERALHYTYEAERYLYRCDLSNPDRKRDLALVLNNLGRVLLEGKRYEEAIHYFNKALSTAEEGATDRDGLRSYMLNNLGVAALMLERLDEAEQLFRDSLVITERDENVFLRTKSLLNLADLYIKVKQFERAIPIATEGLWFANLLGHRTYRFDSCHILGMAHYELGQLEPARSFYGQALEIEPTDQLSSSMLAQLIDAHELHTLLATYFNLEELQTLCFDLDVDYDALSGEGKDAKARELIWHFQRRGLLQELIDTVRRYRPNTALAEIFRFEYEWTRAAKTPGALAEQDFSRQVESAFRILTKKLAVSAMSRASHHSVHAFVVDSSSVFTNLSSLAFLPILFLHRRQLLESDLEDIRLVLSKHLRASHNFAVLVLFCKGKVLQQAQQVLSGKMRQAYAYDIICLGEDDLKLLVGAQRPQQIFRSMVLKHIDLATVSPFVTTGPTADNMFFGREKELREITEHATVTSYAIIGGRRMGKTSILNRLHRVCLPTVGFRTLYHYCSTTLTYDTFLTAAIRDWRPEPPPDVLVTFGDLLQSPPADKPFVLLLDEADKLVPADRANDWRLFNALRALANSNCAQVVLSGERTLRDSLRDPTGPLFNFANEILLGPLDFRAVEELITRPMKQLEIELVDEAEMVRRIYDFTSGHPNVVQRLCQRLIERLNEQGSRRITLHDVDAITKDPSFQRDDFLSTFWEAATSLEKIVSLLMVDDENVRTLRTVRQSLLERHNLYPKAHEVDDALQRLVDLRSILKRTPDGYEFAMKAFPRVVAGTMTLDDMLEILTEGYQEKGE